MKLCGKQTLSVTFLKYCSTDIPHSMAEWQHRHHKAGKSQHKQNIQLPSNTRCQIDSIEEKWMESVMAIFLAFFNIIIIITTLMIIFNHHHHLHHPHDHHYHHPHDHHHSSPPHHQQQQQQQQHYSSNNDINNIQQHRQKRTAYNRPECTTT